MTHWQWTLSFTAFGILVLLIFGLIYESLGERREARRHPPPGKLIAVGDHKLHLLCKGTATPTVVIEQGAGELSRFWWPVQDQIAEFAQVCTYDRAGYAWSDAVPGSRTVEDRADELHALLGAAGIPGPYILVAHSYGGLIIRDFAEKHPGEVAGLVLVDTPDESSIFRPEVLDFYSKIRMMNRVTGFIARFGIFRLLKIWLPLERYGFWLNRPEEYAALCDDLESLEREPAVSRISKAAASLGALPVAVITHGKTFPGPFAILESHWSAGQDRLAALSTRSQLIVAKNSNHMIQQDEPQVVIDAIRSVHQEASLRTAASGLVAG
jgi:pimeloyl-ACP methyl ester carboxylesterase